MIYDRLITSVFNGDSELFDMTSWYIKITIYFNDDWNTQLNPVPSEIDNDFIYYEFFLLSRVTFDYEGFGAQNFSSNDTTGHSRVIAISKFKVWSLLYDILVWNWSEIKQLKIWSVKYVNPTSFHCHVML